jgi:Arc/MetJ-type ribon-helix-helix transcriptional regulator
MPTEHARHIASSDPLAEWAEAQVAEEECNSMSELIRAARRTRRDQGARRSVVRIDPARPSPTAKGRAE